MLSRAPTEATEPCVPLTIPASAPIGSNTGSFQLLPASAGVIDSRWAHMSRAQDAAREERDREAHANPAEEAGVLGPQSERLLHRAPTARPACSSRVTPWTAGRALFCPVTLLQVGYHGNGSSASDEFISAADPKYALVTSGKIDEGTNSLSTV